MSHGSYQLDPRLWEPQARTVIRTMRALNDGHDVCIQSPTGTGKCLAYGTELFTADGRVVKVEDVWAGERLLGPDGKPRDVLSASRGFGFLHRLRPDFGPEVVVNDYHILTLDVDGKLQDIEILDYMREPRGQWVRIPQTLHARRCCPIDPYLFGVICNAHSADFQRFIIPWQLAAIISQDLDRLCEQMGLTMSWVPSENVSLIVSLKAGRRMEHNPFLQAIMSAGIRDSGFPSDLLGYPHDYRMRWLAGFMDAAGTWAGDHLLFRKNETFSKWLVRLGLSLGFKSHFDGIATRIYGKVPTRLKPVPATSVDCFRCGFEITESYLGKYAGFTLSGDGRFLLSDYTVTHNTVQGTELMRWSVAAGRPAMFYVNRRRLLHQVADRLISSGYHVGVRAAGFEGAEDDSAPYQVASLQTEHARVGSSMHHFEAGLVLIDEVHATKGKVLRQCLDRHRESGAKIVALSATPISVKGICDKLIVSGTLQEFRDCGALIPAVVKGVCQPDLRKVRRNPMGEFIMTDSRRRQYTQHIVGGVYDAWRKYNPDARPALLYAPGVKESVYLTRYFTERGVPWAHIDAREIIVDGKRHPSTIQLWLDILDRFRAGEILGISNRFVMREGIDIPEAYHCILATPIGSLTSYLQIVGRIIRYSASTPDMALVTDHGGNYQRHGSPNMDRDWEALWAMSHREASARPPQPPGTPQPIVCTCGTERMGGPKCPDPPFGCGKTAEKARRIVVMESGELVAMDDSTSRPKPPVPPEIAAWKSMFWAIRKGQRSMTFRQLQGWHWSKYRTSLPSGTPFTPISKEDWHANVRDVPFSRLHRS